MQKNFIKICGIQSLDEAMLCYNAGCTALGFLMALTHKAEDEISPGVARKIIKSLPSEIEKVMVTNSLDVNEITRIAKTTEISTIQIHGDMGEKSIIRLKPLSPMPGKIYDLLVMHHFI